MSNNTAIGFIDFGERDSISIMGVDKTFRITERRLEKRGLPCSVATDQSDLFSAANRDAEIVKHLKMTTGAIIRLGETFHF